MVRIVGLGASAGGLEPLAQFLANVPAAGTLAYVIVQHLDPTHKAMLGGLLQRVTAMPVVEARESLQIQPGMVYVIPPNSELTVTGNLLHVSRPPQPRGMRLPIDALFCSLARDQGEQSIGVVLSGMGSDGTLGLLAIKRQGGLTLAQTPASAQFDSMPNTAIAAGCVDIIAPAGELPRRIFLITESTPAAQSPAQAKAPDDQAAALESILGQLRARSKHDLSQYKTKTLLRRIERRMAVHGVATLAQYADFLRQNPLEIDLMFRELLIGVTAFFRDPAVWQEIKESVLPDKLALDTDGKPLRAWVVGCSTGEEAYSLAMVYQEAAAAATGNALPGLQIFATDLSADAIDIARRGRFPASIAKDMDPERLSRFFTAQGDHFYINKSIREMVLFARHDVILDPPFTRLDIVSCRNLLIYFDPALQRRLMPLFHFCLRPGGVLLLGESETIGPADALFSRLSSQSRLYRRGVHRATMGSVDFPVRFRMSQRAHSPESTVSKPISLAVNLQALAEHLLLHEFSPPAVLVNDHGDILYINGHTGRYLEPAAGKANWNVHVMARPGIRTQLALALRQAVNESESQELRGLKIEGGAGPLVDVTIRKILEPSDLAGMLMIIFRDAGQPKARKHARNARSGGIDSEMHDELDRSREEIRALREETRKSQEELQAANEELQSTNEELQSANEELTTSTEEAQSMNEELQTVNNELRSKLEDLALAQSDMQNLLNSTDIATLFLDSDLNVRRFTDQAKRVIHLRDGDIGRPLSDLATTLSYPDLGSDARETLRTLTVSQKEVATTDARWFSVRIMPYRTLSNVIQGVVITFVDITPAKALESRLRKE